METLVGHPASAQNWFIPSRKAIPTSLLGPVGVAATSQLLWCEESVANASVFQVTAWDHKAFSIFKY